MIRRFLVLAAAAALLPMAARPARAQAPTVRLQGTVVDASHRAIDQAEVFVARGDDEYAVRTDSAGKFSFGLVPPGTYRVTARRLGYQPRTTLLELRSGSTSPAELVLEAMPVGFDEIHVVAQVNESYGKLAEFYERRGRPNRQGYFFEDREFSRYDRWLLSEYLRGLPGVTVTPSPRGGGNLVRFRGCQPMIWLDGQRADNVELDDLVIAKDVAAMEVYVSPSGSPGQYRDLSRPCGAILVWKKS